MKYTYFRFAGLFFSIFLSALFIFADSQNLFSAVYYIDDKGVVHFVDDETLIPEKYRGQKRVIEKNGEEGVPEKQGEKKEILKKNEGEIVKDKFGNTPSFWRQKYKGLIDEKFKKEKELRELEAQRDDLLAKYENVRSRAYFIGDSQSVTAAANLGLRIQEIENMIKITIRQLDEINKKISVDIYDEIIEAGGKTEWLLMEE